MNDLKHVQGRLCGSDAASCGVNDDCLGEVTSPAEAPFVGDSFCTLHQDAWS